MNSDITIVSGDAKEVLEIVTMATEEYKDTVRKWWVTKQDEASAA